ncbi:MAG: 2'-5' RNA ligase family protein [Gordonia sp. (in: high G+C Gram-positive bacteria)]|uniref:2'-5' RNA ligase family protein n=1 Tax=Gordonia TaxID=2053 RepID=UPI003263954B
MAHSIEILLDSDTDAAIREQWHTLEAADLPSAGRVRSGTNRPHCTLLAGTSIAGAADPALGVLAQRLPFALTLGGALVFPAGRRFTLVRAVIPSAELLSVHATALRLAGPQVTDLAAHCGVGDWTPHVTLARRLTAEQLVTALQILAWPTIAGRATSLRRWDGDAKTEHVTAGRAC